MKRVQQKTERKISAALRLALVALLLLLQIAVVVALSMVLKQKIYIAYAILEIMAVLCVARIYTRPGSSTYKPGWIVLIMLVPVVGVILYWLWNGNQMKKKLALKTLAMPEELPAVRESSARAQSNLTRRWPRWGKLAEYLRRQDFPLFENTEMTYFPTGEAYLEDLLAEMEKAKRFIFLEYYIASKGQIWDRICEVLTERAAAGVEVNLILDDFGSMMTMPPEEIDALRQKGIWVQMFNPVHQYVNRLSFNYRDHRKIAVIDGDIAYTGGANLADEYANLIVRFGYWKDAGLRIEGAAVWNFTVMFLDFWNAFRPFEQDYSAFRPQFAVLPASDGVVQPYADSPLDEEPVAETVYLDILAQAQQYVYFYTPYLAIGEEMLDALRNAAKRGVDVRLVLPGIPDKKLVFRLSRSYYLPLLRAGVRIYEYTPGFLHAKCCVSDDRAAVVGSINMDYRSMFLHFECGVLLLQNSQVLALRDDVRRTLPQCREVQCADCRTGLAGTVLDSVLRLLSPLM